jgi:uncharacterized membrane protein YccC
MINSEAIRAAVQMTLVSVAAYWIGFQTTNLFHGASASIGGLWSVVSGVVVLQSTRRDTLSSAWLRILGTAMGSIISAAYLALLPFSPSGMAASMLITVLLCDAVRIPDHGRLAAITVAVVMVTSSLNPTLNPIQNAALRFGESCIGTALAVLAVLIWPGSTESPQSVTSGNSR